MNTPLELLDADLRHLDDRAGDILVLTVFSDERPLRGLAGLVDWRLSGRLSRWLMAGLMGAAAGDQVLYPTRGRLSHPLLLFLGLGARAQHRTDRAFAAATGAARTARGLGARKMTCGLFGLERLPTPLERSIPGLIDALCHDGGLASIALAVAPDLRAVVTAAAGRPAPPRR